MLPENKKLYEKVLERGAILSEFPLGTHPAPENFPIRNRIVAGMPLGVIVIEGAEFSGSLITARLAMEFGREVFGVPGNVTQAVSYAPNMLIKLGAKLVVNAEGVIEELPLGVAIECLKVIGGAESETFIRLCHQIADIDFGRRRIHDGLGDASDQEVRNETGE